jgi:organic radical activating enzyme
MNHVEVPRRTYTAAQTLVNDVAWVDTNDVCNLKCPTCFRGVRAWANNGNRIDLDTFAAIVAKIADEGYKRIGVFNWTEPFVNPDLDKCMQIIKEHGLYSMVSTNFSIRRIPHLEKVLRYTDMMIITVSGFDQAVYEINHVAGDIELVKANTRRAATAKACGAIATTIQLRFLKFEYNHDQEEKLRAFADKLKIAFEVIPGWGDPTNPVSATAEKYEDQLRSFTPARPYDQPGKICSLMFGQVPIDSHGDVYLCCAYPNLERLKIGPYLEMTQEEILLRRYNHPMCASCGATRRDATPADTQVLIEAVQHKMMQPGSTEARLQDEVGQLTTAEQNLRISQARLQEEVGQLTTAERSLRLDAESLRSRLDHAQGALADLKRSRLLRLGRGLRRLIGRPSPY